MEVLKFGAFYTKLQYFDTFKKCCVEFPNSPTILTYWSPYQILGEDALRSVGLGKSKRKSERNEGLSALPE